MAPVLTVGIAEEAQAGLIALMKASPAMMSAVAVGADGQKEIREDDWMSRNFKYPAYRLQILTLGPDAVANIVCAGYRPLAISFSVLCFAEGDSSLPCLRLMDIARNALLDKFLSTPSLMPLSVGITFPNGAMIMPVPESGRQWRGEVQFSTSVRERLWFI